MQHYTVSKAKIANGETVGVAVDLRGQRLVAVGTPAALTGTTLSFSACDTELGTYKAVHFVSTLASAVLTITSVAANLHIMLPDGKTPANCFLKLISGGAEAADREFTLFTEPL